MGLRTLLARAAVARAHVLLIELPGGHRERIAAEREVARRGWVLAGSPVDADILCVCGADTPQLMRFVEHVWAQLPGPRARVRVHPGHDAAAALTAGRDTLADVHGQQRREQQRAPDEQGRVDDDASDMNDGDDMSDGDDASDMDDMDMPMPGGIPLAGGGPDRDGLDLDVLNVPLGPVLPLWPAGLVVHCRLQGDLVLTATAQLFGADADRPAPSTGGDVVAHQCDLAARLLTLAGAEPAADRVRAIRDAALDGPGRTCRAALATELARLRRSVLLRRSLRGVGVIRAQDLRALRGTEGHHLAGSDAWSRLLAMLEVAAAALTGSAPPGSGPSGAQLATLLPVLMAGHDLAAARLTVASLDFRPLGLRAEAPR